MTHRYQVVAIGNALVDVLASVEEAHLAEHGVPKGTMQLIGSEDAARLYGAMPPAREISGGSAANTVAGLAALGVRTAFVGKTGNDQLGRIFAHDMKSLGARYDGPVGNGTETGRCLVMVTPDGERSMSTFLGISAELAPEDIDVTLAAAAEWLYLEGYLFDSPAAKQAYARAISAAKEGGGRVAFTLSDPFCVGRHRQDMRRMIAESVDLLFANKAELLALYETEDLEAALDAVGRDATLTAVTLSEEGVIVVAPEGRFPTASVATKVVDTTGAGDLFAAGFLAGLARGRGPLDCARMGCIAAAEVISHIGARPEADLSRLMAEQGL